MFRFRLSRLKKEALPITALGLTFVKREDCTGRAPPATTRHSPAGEKIPRRQLLFETVFVNKKNSDRRLIL
jgi:hypothetical protein